jgi:uncharacterized protein with PQ loop repeat
MVADVLNYAPVAAAAFAIPQFLPQVIKLRRTGDTAGVSWSWATLTSVNNPAWIAYFAVSGYWTALVPSSSSAVLAGALATMLARRGHAATADVADRGVGRVPHRGIRPGGARRPGNGAHGRPVVQVTPSIWTVYRTNRPTGTSRGTWMLIFGELSCWAAFGVHESDPRLLILGLTGVSASVLMLQRIRRTGAQPA